MANKPSAPCSAVKIAHTRRMELLIRRGYVSLIVRFCVIIIAAILVFSQLFLLTQCKGQGMFPAIEDGDLILAYRLHKDYQKGDVVVYKVNGKSHLGRVVAKQTDTVMMDDSGLLSVNGTTQGGEIMYPTYAKEGITYPYRISGEELFVLGDYRTQAEDSRDFGPIPLDKVKGKVITIVRRRGV